METGQGAEKASSLRDAQGAVRRPWGRTLGPAVRAEGRQEAQEEALPVWAADSGLARLRVLWVGSGGLASTSLQARGGRSPQLARPPAGQASTHGPDLGTPAPALLVGDTMREGAHQRDPPQSTGPLLLLPGWLASKGRRGGGQQLPGRFPRSAAQDVPPGLQGRGQCPRGSWVLQPAQVRPEQRPVVATGPLCHRPPPAVPSDPVSPHWPPGG